MLTKECTDGEQDRSYNVNEHKLWAEMFAQNAAVSGLSLAYIAGRKAINFDPERIEGLSAISHRLQALSGWSLVPADGLLPTPAFFRLLTQMEFPIATTMRSADELHFSRLPDVFHDLVGHVPMLATGEISGFLVEFGETALKHIDNRKALRSLGRYFWYTIETGLVREEDDVCLFGAAVITSPSEVANANKPGSPRQVFDVASMMKTKYNHLELQERYFVLDSRKKLLSGLRTVRQHIEGEQVSARGPFDTNETVTPTNCNTDQP